jgi:K+-sensing histidine kinase KdpD
MKAPLVAIMMCVELAIRALNLSGHQVELLNPIRYSAQLLTCQVNNLLDQSLMVKGEFEVRFTRTNIRKLIKNMVGIFEA